MPCRVPLKKVAKKSSRMAGRVLLDTNVIIAFFSGEKGVSKQFADAEVFVSSTVLGELYYGARKSAHAAANLARIEQFAASVEVLSCDAATAQIYGKLRDQLRSKGRPIPENDIWIAAVALQHALTLATRDEHFNEVDGLHIENW
jgi:tRNA(fMet)-specific endonuclease VapC